MAKALTNSEYEEFRDRFCDTAARLFASEGFTAVTIRRLATETGCSRQTPYRFFRNKDDIFAEVFLRCHRIFTGYCERAAETASGPRETILAIRDAYVRFATDEPHAYEVIFGMDPPLESAKVAKQMEYARSSLEEIFRRAVDEGEAEGDPRSLAFVFWITLDGLARLKKSGPERFGLDLAKTSDVIEGMFLTRAAQPV